MMTPPKTNHQPQRSTRPQQVWATLTIAQQQIIVRTMVKVCQQLVAQWKPEADHEPVSKG